MSPNQLFNPFHLIFYTTFADSWPLGAWKDSRPRLAWRSRRCTKAECLASSPRCKSHAIASQRHNLGFYKWSVQQPWFLHNQILESRCWGAELPLYEAGKPLSRMFESWRVWYFDYWGTSEAVSIPYLSLAYSTSYVTNWRVCHLVCKFRSYLQGGSGRSLP